MHARKTSEREEQTKLRAALEPGGSVAKKLGDAKLARELDDAKRKGKIGSGDVSGGNGGGKRGDKGGASDFSKSAKFFKQLQQGGKEGMAGRKRSAPGGDDEAGRTGMRVKL